MGTTQVLMPECANTISSTCVMYVATPCGVASSPCGRSSSKRILPLQQRSGSKSFHRISYYSHLTIHLIYCFSKQVVIKSARFSGSAEAEAMTVESADSYGSLVIMVERTQAFSSRMPQLPSLIMA